MFDDRLGSVVDRLLQHAEELYQRSMPGIAHLPRDCRTGIYAARLIYAEIGKEIERHGFDSFNRRAIVSSGRTVLLLASAFKASMMAGRACRMSSLDLPPLSETRFLVDAVTSNAAGLAAGTTTPDLAWWAFHQRLAWTIELFTRLALEERLQRSRH